MASISWNTIQEANKDFAPPAIGQHIIQILDGEWSLTAKGIPCFKLRAEVVSGKDMSKIIFDQFTLNTDYAFVINNFFNCLEVLGIPRDQVNSENEASIPGRIKGCYAKVDITHREWQGNVRANIDKYYTVPSEDQHMLT